MFVRVFGAAVWHVVRRPRIRARVNSDYLFPNGVLITMDEGVDAKSRDN